jgi:hypothetical protein
VETVVVHHVMEIDGFPSIDIVTCFPNVDLPHYLLMSSHVACDSFAGCLSIVTESQYT